MIRLEYCECGCHGSCTPTVGGVQFWVYWPDVDVDLQYVRSGHSWSGRVLKRGTRAECDAFLQEQLKILVNQELMQLTKLAVELGTPV